MSAKKRPPKPAPLFVHIGVDLAELLDAHVKTQQRANPGRRVTRSDVVREMLHKMLSE